MKLKLLKTKARTPEGCCRAVGCSEPAVCFWKNKPVCSKHYFWLRNLARLTFRINRMKGGHQENEN